MKKYTERIMATAKAAWEEREALCEAIASNAKKNSTTLQRYILTGLVFILVLVVTARVVDHSAPPSRMELAVVAQTIVDEQEQEEAQRALETAQKEARLKEEAEAVARVVYGMARNHATQHQETVVWCILNRVDDSRFADDIIEVCNQPAQWVEYYDTNPVLESMYQMAYRIISDWRNGAHRPMAPDFVFAERTGDSIILRNTYEYTSRTRYYEA